MKINVVGLNYRMLKLFLLINIMCKFTAANFVALFDHSNGEGESLTLNVKSCIALQRGWTDRVSSVLLMSESCLELHESRICNDFSPVIVLNDKNDGAVINLSGEYEFNDRTRGVKPCSFLARGIANDATTNTANSGLRITLYEFVDRKGNQVDINVISCARVPLPLYRNTASVNTHGHCVRLYSGSHCTGDSVQIQPNDESGSANLHQWNFLDMTSSIGTCAEFQILALTLHNTLRARHNVPRLQLDELLNNESKLAAQILANQNDAPTQTIFNTGFLLVFSQLFVTRDPVTLVQQAIRAWYAERVTFDPSNPISSPFTQLMQRLSQEIRVGVGISTANRRSVVVVKYSPVSTQAQDEFR